VLLPCEAAELLVAGERRAQVLAGRLRSAHDGNRDLAHLDAKGWGRRPVRISLAVDLSEIDPGLLLYAAFIVHQLAGDAATAASTGAVAATGAYSG
jgi:hypothetical protein